MVRIAALALLLTACGTMETTEEFIEADVLRLSLVETVDVHQDITLTEDGWRIAEEGEAMQDSPARPGLVDQDGRMWVLTGHRTSDGVRVWRVFDGDESFDVAVGHIHQASGDRVVVLDDGAHILTWK